MDQQNYSPQGQPGPSGVKPIWLIVLFVLVIALIGVLFWQKSIANQIADSLQKQIIALQNQILQNNNQPGDGQAVNCVKEGVQGGTETNTIENRNLKSCCGGLSKVDMTTFWEGVCENASGASIDMLFTCINCGNGVCGLGENQCNCPQDCSGYKTYINSKYGYMVNYPGGMAATSGNIDSQMPPQATSQDTIVSISGLGCSLGISAGYSDEEIADLKSKGYTESTINISGLNGKRLSGTKVYEMEAAYFKDAKGVAFRINSEGANARGQVCLLAFNELLSSFQFSK